MTFGERLRSLRQKKNMTQKELSKALFISERVISYYEQNERFPNDAMTLIRIANYFNVSIDYLLDMPVGIPTGMPTVNGNRKIPPDLHELITLYSELNDYEKGRVLQFVIDLHEKE